MSDTAAGLIQALHGHDAWLDRRAVLRRPDVLSIFLSHAVRLVPFYRARFSDDSRDRVRLDRFPVISRSDLAGDRNAFLVSDAGASGLFAKTSGSTGDPLTVTFDAASWYDLNYGTYEAVARVIRGLSARVAPGRTGVVLLTNETNRHPTALVLVSLRGALFERRILGRHHDSDRRLVQELRTNTPPLLYAKPSYLCRLAELDAETGPASIRPLALLTSGENLFPDVRRALEQAFRCRVYDAYISVEGGLVALQCPRTASYHVRSDRVRLEVLRANGIVSPTGTGELVVTNLANWAMPIIRYRSGDQGTVRARCSCGHEGPTIVDLPARETTSFRVPRGLVRTTTLDRVLRTKHVKQFHLVHTTPRAFTLTWIPSSDSVKRDEESARLATRLEAVLGVPVRAAAVESITKSGGKARRYATGTATGSGAAGRVTEVRVRRVPRGCPSIVTDVLLCDRQSTVVAAVGRSLLHADTKGSRGTFRPLRTFRSTVTCLAASSSSSICVVGERRGDVQVIDVSSGRTVNSLSRPRLPVTCAACTGDGRRIVTGWHDGSVRVSDGSQWLAETRANRAGGPVICVAVSLDTMLVATARADGTLSLWNGLELGRSRVCAHGETLSLSVTPDGDALACGSADGSVKLVDAWSGRLLGELRGHSGPVVAVVFSPDAKTVVSGSRDGTLKVWQAWSGRLLETWTGHKGGVRSMFVAGDGRTIVSGGHDGSVRLWPLVPVTER